MNKKNIFIVYDFHLRQIHCRGSWNVDHLTDLSAELQALNPTQSPAQSIDGSELKELDSAGAWVLNSLIAKYSSKNHKIELKNFSEEKLKLLSLVKNQLDKKTEIKHPLREPLLAQLGKGTIDYLIEARDFLAFTGYLTLEAITIFKHPARIRFGDFVSVIQRAGNQALPIIALISFMVGIVLAHQMSLQLKNYGANIFIVDFLGYASLREFGPLITAIMVAGRTGSAFTAQLGTMKINQEIDALDTMGITSAELLLLPRLAGLFVALPLLTIWADIFCIVGGMLVAKGILHITWIDFMVRFQRQIPVSYLLIGLGKAPIFALIIGSIGCFEGVKVSGSAESIGTQTTRSVVLAIFFIIVADALFSIVLSKFHF